MRDDECRRGQAVQRTACAHEHISCPLSCVAESFPCHIVFDQELELVEAGQGLHEKCPELSAAGRLDRVFRIRRPALPFSFSAVRERTGAPLVLESLADRTLVQGRAIHAEALGLMLFLASPWMTRVEELADLGLSLDDFAVHDSFEGFLALVGARNAALGEASELARKLAHETRELASARQRLSACSSVLAALAGSPSRDEAARKVAHDFNNVLVVIGGAAEILASEDALPASLAVEVQEIRKACVRGAALTRLLLAPNRREAPRPRPVDLAVVLADLSSMLRRLLGEEIELVLRCEPGLGTIQADPVQLEQVIVNLAVNARDAMAGGGTLAIETASASPQDDLPPIRDGPRVGQPHVRRPLTLDAPAYPCVVLSARDTGCGMGPETVARIFEPFFTTKEPGKGTGLGLSIVHGIVTSMGGTLSVETEPGAGTTFTIVLPTGH
ncbi:MAG: hypothetical protein HY720_02720 [Planctomycetes bacterium]|nr:hypothetical protein [Planctomycetota bacterium]